MKDEERTLKYKAKINYTFLKGEHFQSKEKFIKN
jgi:hypothetical protein